MRLLFQNMCSVRGSLVFHVWSMVIASQALRTPPGRSPAARSFFADVPRPNMSEDCRTCASQHLFLVFIEASWAMGLCWF